MKNAIDKKGLTLLIVISVVLVCYFIFSNNIRNIVEYIFLHEQWTYWLAIAVAVLELSNKIKKDGFKFRIGNNIQDFFKTTKEYFDVFIEPGIFVCSLSLLRGSVLYLFYLQKDFFPRYSQTIVSFIFIISLFALIHSVIKIQEIFKETIFAVKEGADVAGDNQNPN